MQMSQNEIGCYYLGLTNGEKGLFTAYVSVQLGGSPHTWQNKFLAWSRNKVLRPLSPVLRKELSAIVQQASWKTSY